MRAIFNGDTSLDMFPYGKNGVLVPVDMEAIGEAVVLFPTQDLLDRPIQIQGTSKGQIILDRCGCVFFAFSPYSFAAIFSSVGIDYD